MHKTTKILENRFRHKSSNRSSLFYLSYLLRISFCLMIPYEANAIEEMIKKPPKILHLTFHKGCANEFEGIAKHFGLDLTTWVIQNFPPKWFDGISQGNALYNMGHDRAKRIWDLHKETFLEFDAIITSDTAPLSRIFLQNGWEKPLLIWICNRFDYCDCASLDCDFPDREYYQLFRLVNKLPNVKIIGYTAYEHYYARSKGVDTGSFIITPTGLFLQKEFVSSIPENIAKEETIFLPPYHNERFFMDLSTHCSSLGISNYCGRYNGPKDLQNFKGIVHLPCAWSNLAFFENIGLGIPYFVPSKKFLKTLMQGDHLFKKDNYFHTQSYSLLNENRFDLSEWFQPGREEIITYFDSWEDLKYKIATADYPLLRIKSRQYAEQHQSIMLERWSKIFDFISSY
jgi:hypothetical protein